MDVTLPNGQVIRGVPEGTPKDVIKQRAIAAGIAAESDFGEPEPRPVLPEDSDVPMAPGEPGYEQWAQSFGRQEAASERSALDVAKGVGETALTMGTGATLGTFGQIAGTLEGLAKEVASGQYGSQEAANRIQDLAMKYASSMTYEPKTEAGREYTQAVGEAAEPLAALTPMTAEITGAMTAAAMRPKAARPAPTQAERFATGQGVPIHTTDIKPPRTFAGKSAQAAAEKIPVAGTAGMRRAQQEARVGLVQQLGDKFGTYDPADVVKSLQGSANKVKQAAGKARGSYAEKVSDVAAVNKVIGVIDDEIDKMSRSPAGAVRETADTQTINALNAYKNDLMNDPSFANLDSLRSSFRETVKGERNIVPGRGDAAIQRVYNAMTSDMDDAIRSSLGDEAFSKWKKANIVYGQEAEMLKKSRLKSVLQKGNVTPETVNNLLYSNKPSEVKALYAGLDAKGKAAARAGVIAKALEKAGDSPDKLLGELSRLTKNTDIVFKGADADYINGLKAYLQATKRASEAGVLTATGEQLFQLGAPAALVGDIASTGGVGTAGAGVYGLMARAYESQAFRSVMSALSRAKPGTNEYINALGEASALITYMSNRPDEAETPQTKPIGEI